MYVINLIAVDSNSRYESKYDTKTKKNPYLENHAMQEVFNMIFELRSSEC